MGTFVLTMLMAAVTASAPRLELTRGPNPPGAYPGFTITLTLINDSTQSVEAPPDGDLRPRVLDEHGAPVALADLRANACLGAPMIPSPPADPVRPGQRQVVARYTIFYVDGVWHCSVPNGGGTLAPGRYRFRTSATLGATIKADWIAQYELGTRSRPKGKHETAAQVAAHYDQHWTEVASFWTGHLDSNELEVEIAAHP